ncbi:MAG: GTP-binding protein [Patescibacteria group bacterium]
MTENIRNFVIIAHVDAGKSTLADRFLEITGTVEKRQMKAQFLDQLELERERGITIKMAPVRMSYTLNAKPYTLNLIDTPGHPDFSYEVSRALAAVEGAILLVDATQGIQAQTLANFYAAKKQGLRIIGAVNKVDLNPPQLQSVIKETADLIGCALEEIFKVSAKTGEGVKALLETIIKFVPAPSEVFRNTPPVFLTEPRSARSSGSPPLDSRAAESDRGRTPSSAALRDIPHETQAAYLSKALIFDSFYDDHKGIIASVRVFSGEFRAGEETKLTAGREKFKIKELGFFTPQLKITEKLQSGEIGYVATGLKDPDKLKIGDTIGNEALAGYNEPKPVVFVSFYPDNCEYDELKKSLQRLKLNDSALKIEPDFNEVLGRGFKIGFLGKLHFEITVERLEREFGIKTINSFPSVAYKIKEKIIENVEGLPDDLSEIQEPMVNLEIISPVKYLGDIFQLKEIFRMEDIKTENLSAERILIKAKMPLVELISDFDDRLKSVSEGFASFSYELGEYQRAELEKMEILVAGFKVPGLTRVVPKNKIEHEARKTVDKLKEVLPRQQFNQAIQAKAGGRIIARENVPALKKDVTGYLYGGDRTRKMKLWKKQKKGKKKLATLAGQSRIQIPSEVFKKMLK